MEKVQIVILVKLLIAHLLTDFVFQPDRWVNERKSKEIKSPYLYVHCLIAGLLSYILIGKWGWWHLIPIISLTHLVIDIWKIKQRSNAVKVFIIDQSLHVITLIIIWLFQISGWKLLYNEIICIANDYNILMIVLGYVIILWPSGIIIREITANWRKQIKSKKSEKESLNKAGKWIGFLERFLALTFILINQFAAIGFLIAAKSILRLNPNDEKKTRKYTEYVLLGTLISFTITIIIGLILRGTVNILPAK